MSALDAEVGFVSDKKPMMMARNGSDGTALALWRCVKYGSTSGQLTS
jgi:hypothetical protein